MRIEIGGTIVEDVSEYGRNANLFHRMLQTAEYCANSGIEDGAFYNEGREHFDLPHEIPVPIYIGEAYH